MDEACGLKTIVCDDVLLTIQKFVILISLSRQLWYKTARKLIFFLAESEVVP